MPVTLFGQTYYKPVEVCRIAGMTRDTFLRWVQYGTLPYTEKNQVSAQLDTNAHRMLREQGLVDSRHVDQLKTDVKKVKRNVFLRIGKRIEIL
jgi:hypothetical protein